ncbi:xylosyl- and glucuronyltransferase LARGE2-like [Liolophura sinensis]|uniref:xylosyl- and glucuronyltransferase LARGE2-like n=1 Tax=Liolophura sinensis TaxID=3198878 RepID=UPI003158A750
MAIFKCVPKRKLAEWIKRDFSLLKMKIYRLLPQVEKVIVLDPSYLVHCDIKELWRVFDEFNSSQVIATTGIPKANPIIESKTNPYVYDFGVALLYLQRLREDDVVAMLDLEMQKFFFYSKSYLFAKEKEILEIVLRNHTDLVFNLPCKWNVQLNDEESFCFATESSDFMRPVVQVSNHSCWAYNKQAQRNYRTQLFFWGRNTSIDSKEFEVTLVSHFGGESLSLLDKMAFHWSGPMSLTAFLTDQEVIIFKMAIQISTYLKKRRNVVFNLVIKNGPTYPVEYLERVAFEQATTAYVFMTDFDNLPMKAIYGDLRAHVTRAGIEQMKKTALVVPGYISKLHRTQQPWTIVKLHEQMALGEYAASNNLLKEGSLSLDYLSHSDGQSNNNSWQYAFEWSIVVPRLFVKQSFERYKEHFYIGKYSRQALIAELYAAGYLFAPLHDLFVLRMPHSRTEIQMKPEDHKLWERCLSWNWTEYLKTVSRDYDVKVERLLKVFPLSSEME